MRYRRALRAVLPLLVSALALLSAAAGPAGAGVEPHIRLSPAMTSVDYDGGLVSIFVPVTDLDHHGQISYDDDRDTVPDRESPSNGLGAFELLLTFDPDVVRVESGDPGPFIENSGRHAQCFDREPERGQYALACVTTGDEDGAQGSGTLATIILRPLANGTSFLRLDAQLSGPLGDSIPVRVDGGIIEVRGGPDAPPDDGDGGPVDENPRPIGGPEGNGGSGNGTGGDNTAGPPTNGGDRGGGGSADGGNVNDPSAPSAGTGYRPFENDGRSIAGVLALAGGLLLLVWYRVAAASPTD